MAVFTIYHDWIILYDCFNVIQWPTLMKHKSCFQTCAKLRIMCWNPPERSLEFLLSATDSTLDNVQVSPFETNEQENLRRILCGRRKMSRELLVIRADPNVMITSYLLHRPSTLIVVVNSEWRNSCSMVPVWNRLNMNHTKHNFPGLDVFFFFLQEERRNHLTLVYFIDAMSLNREFFLL